MHHSNSRAGIPSETSSSPPPAPGARAQVLVAELLPDPAQQAGPQWAAYVGLEHALDAFFALELAVKALAHWRTPRGRPFADRPVPAPSPPSGSEVMCRDCAVMCTQLPV